MWSITPPSPLIQNSLKLAESCGTIGEAVHGILSDRQVETLNRLGTKHLDIL